MEFEVVDGKFVQKQSGESVKPEVLDTLAGALSKTVSNYKSLIEHFSKGLNEVDLSELAPSAVIKVDEVGNAPGKVMATLEVDMNPLLAKIDYLSEGMSKVAKVQQQSGNKVGKVAPWNKKIWFAIPALRKEPFSSLERARAHVWAQDPQKVPRAHVYAFPSRQDARAGINMDRMPSEVVWNS